MLQPLVGSLLYAAAKHVGNASARAIMRRLTVDSGSAPGEVLRAAQKLREEANEIVVQAVAYERSRGTTWQQIGDVLGMTRQSAHKLYQSAVDHQLRSLSTDDCLRDRRMP